MVIEARRGGPDDLPSVEALWLTMHAHHEALTGAVLPLFDPAASWAARQAEYRGWLADGTGTLLLAHAGGPEPIGYAFVRIRANHSVTWDLGDPVGDLESLAVHSDARNQGVGAALIAAARAVLRERGVAYWTVSVVEGNAAERLYERSGFGPHVRTLAGPVDR